MKAGFHSSAPNQEAFWRRRVRDEAAGVLVAIVCVCAVLGANQTSRGQSIGLVKGFEGNSTGWIPADPIIAAGPSSLVTMVNGSIAIFDKQGLKRFEQTLGLGGFWSGQVADQVAEPWVIFDPNSSRFIASAAEFGNGKGKLYFAISKTSNPLGSADWYKYSLDRSSTHQGAEFPGVPTYPDYAKVGVDNNALYVTALHFAKDQNITSIFSHVEIFALNKASLLSGGPLDVVYEEPVIVNSYSPHLVFGIHPAVVFGPAPAMYFVQSLITKPDDKIVVHAWTDVLSGNPSKSVSLVPVTPFDRPPDVPQLGSTALLENMGARLMSAVVRNGSLWTSHAVQDPADGKSVVRWYQFDVNALPGTGATRVQQGDVSTGPGIHTWLPHINVDANGNMGLCFSVGSANQYAALGYTGRLANDPLGWTALYQVARAGESAYTKGGWGEYTGLAIDPDGYTFWLFGEYPSKVKGIGAWRTFVGAFQLAAPPPPPNPLHCGDLDGSSATSGKNWKANVVVTVHDSSHNVIPGATVSAQWSGGYSGSASLTTDSLGRCTFTSGAISKTTTSVTLTVLNVTHSTLSYIPAGNHDPDSDSNGTTISVIKP